MMIAVETDEFAHQSYKEDDEKNRYNDIVFHNPMKYIWIRFNPDGYGSNGEKIDLEDKIEALMEKIQWAIDRVNADENEFGEDPYYLFYPSTSRHLIASSSDAGPSGVRVYDEA